MAFAPIVLVPGFWLGAWAWDDVASVLRADGHRVTAITLPGLEAVDADRSAVTLSDHVEAICAAVADAGDPAVLVVHSGAAVPGYAASGRVPERVAAMVYVDCGPPTGAIDPGFDGVELPLPSWEELGENLDGLSGDRLEEFRRRAVPQPGCALREKPEPADRARLDVPSTVICTSFPSQEVKAAAEQGFPLLAGLTELSDVTYVDLPTSHWPMWSRPRELAALIGNATRNAASR